MTRMILACGCCLLLTAAAAAAQEIFDAARAGDLARVTALVEADPALVAARSPSAKTPLTYAAQAGHLEVVSYLIGRGADPNAGNVSHETPLIYAAWFGHAEVVACLLAHGADPNLASDSGDNALDVAIMRGFAPIVGLLEAAGAVPTVIGAPELDRLTDRITRIAFPYAEAPNILACRGPDGLLLVDTGWQRTLPDLRRTLRALDERDVVAIINTHDHEDHVGGNAVAGAGAPVITLPGLATLAAAGTIRPGAGPLSGPSGHAFATYFTLDFGGESIRLIPAPGAHTDSDLIVHFTGSNLVDLGDLLILQSFPSVTEAVDEYLEILATVCDVFPADAILVCGHGQGGSTADVARYRDMLVTVRNLVEARLDAGRSREEIVKDAALAEYAAYGTFIPVLGVDYWVDAVCRHRAPAGQAPR